MTDQQDKALEAFFGGFAEALDIAADHAVAVGLDRRLFVKATMAEARAAWKRATRRYCHTEWSEARRVRRAVPLGFW